MTATAERISKNTKALTDRELTQLVTELFNDATDRYHDPDATEDTKQVIGAMWWGFYGTFRPQVIEEVKPAVEQGMRKLTDKLAHKGRVTLALRFATALTIDDGVNTRTLAAGELVNAGYDYGKVFSERVFQHLEIADLEDGQVISLDVPSHITVLRERVVDTSRVALPDNWTSDLAGALASAFKQLPAPQVDVENVVETPVVNVEVVNAPDDGEQAISFDRDRTGRISGAKIKPA